MKMSPVSMMLKVSLRLPMLRVNDIPFLLDGAGRARGNTRPIWERKRGRTVAERFGDRSPVVGCTAPSRQVWRTRPRLSSLPAVLDVGGIGVFGRNAG